MSEEFIETIGEGAPTAEDVRKLINIASTTPIRKPKMSLEELIEAAREIDSEINMFEARWMDKVDTLTYRDAINLIFSEIDRYPTIKKYNADRQEILQFDLVEGLKNSLSKELKTNWPFVKERLIMKLTPNRWV